MEAAKRDKNPKYDYLQRHLTLLDSLKDTGDYAAHHQSGHAMVAPTHAKAYLDVITGLVQHFETNGKP